MPPVPDPAKTYSTLRIGLLGFALGAIGAWVLSVLVGYERPRWLLTGSAKFVSLTAWPLLIAGTLLWLGGDIRRWIDSFVQRARKLPGGIELEERQPERMSFPQPPAVGTLPDASEEKR